MCIIHICIRVLSQLHLVFVFVLEPTGYNTKLFFFQFFRRGFHVLFCIPKAIEWEQGVIEGKLAIVNLSSTVAKVLVCKPGGQVSYSPSG
jgi:hypothetical protein